MSELNHYWVVQEKKKDGFFVRLQRDSQTVVANSQSDNNSTFLFCFESCVWEEMSHLEKLQMRQMYGEYVFLLDLAYAEKVGSFGWVFDPNAVKDFTLL